MFTLRIQTDLRGLAIQVDGKFQAIGTGLNVLSETIGAGILQRNANHSAIGQRGQPIRRKAIIYIDDRYTSAGQGGINFVFSAVNALDGIKALNMRGTHIVDHGDLWSGE